MKVVKKLFICQKDPSKSFAMEFSEKEFENISIGELIQKAGRYFKQKSELFEIRTTRNPISSFSNFDADTLVRNSHVNIYPIYFTEEQALFKFNVRYNGEILTILSKSYQKSDLLNSFSERFQVPKNRLYLLSESKPVDFYLKSDNEIDIFVASDKLFYNNQEIYVDFNLSVETNLNVFGFAYSNTQIYKGQKVISKSETFASQGIAAEDRLYSYFMQKVQIKDISTEIKSTYYKKEALELYLHYFPDEKGKLVIVEIEDTLHFSLDTKCEMVITFKLPTGLSCKIETRSDVTIQSLKEKIATQYDLVPERLLFFAGRRQLESGRTLDSYDIQEESIIEVIEKKAMIQKSYTKEDLEKTLTVEIKTLSGKSYHVNCKLSNSVEDLKNEIIKQIEMTSDEMRLIFCGSSLESNQQLSHYDIEQSSVIHLAFMPKESYKKVRTLTSKYTDPKKNIGIFAKTLAGKTIYIQCHTSDYIETIKQYIESKEGTSAQSLRLIKVSQQLEDGYQVYEYGIDNDCSLNTVARLSGGGPRPQTKSFVDLENENSKKQKSFSKSAPNYRIVGKGLNVEGICENNECNYYKNQVICMLRFASVEIIKDECNQIICPGCQKSIQLITCGFLDCQYSWCGIKVENDKERLVESQKILLADDNSYTTYDPINQDGSSNMVEWKQLFLYAKYKESTKFPTCSICLTQIYKEEDITTPEVCFDNIRHKCHFQCLENISFLEKKCIICSPYS